MRDTLAVVKTTVKQTVLLQPMEIHGGADIHLQPMEDPMLEQMAVTYGNPTLELIPSRT